MRNSFAKTVTSLALEDPRIVLLSGDIGNKLFDGFKAAAADRFFNCGVAEANLIGMGSGMAMCGLRPVAYTIAPFITYRCYEQIRIDLCYHKQSVVIVGVGSGLGYASLGATHHSLEDIAVMRALPEMTVYCPADPLEVGPALRSALNLPGPSYIRIGKKGEPHVHSSPPSVVPGEAIETKQGSEIAILSTGTTLQLAHAVADQLTAQTASTAVYHFPTVKPLDHQRIADCAQRFRALISIEEHSIIGGFGSAIAESLVDHQLNAKLLRIGTSDRFIHCAGEEHYARESMGLSESAITRQIIEFVKQ